MAHRVKVRRVPWVKVDGTISATKKRWEFSCRSRGKVCCSPILLDTEAALQLVRQRHWEAVKDRGGKPTGWTPKRPSTVHPARRAARVAQQHDMDRQNAALDALREM